MSIESYSSPSFTFSLNVNSSLEQITEPLADYEIAICLLFVMITVVGTPIIMLQWKRFGRGSPRPLKLSLALMYITLYLELPFGILSASQAATPSHIPFYFSQILYTCFLAVSELVDTCICTITQY